MVQFGTFGMVGVAGLAADVAVLWACLRVLGINPYAARLVSFLCAATVTWALNRRFTFRDARAEPAHRQWARFLAANAFGGVVNVSVYTGLVATVPLFGRYPELAVAAGSLGGMLFNFTASRTLVFKRA